MLNVDTFSTDAVAPRERVLYWNDRASNFIVPLSSKPKDAAHFRGSICRGAVGEVTLAEVYSDAQVVTHNEAHVARTAESIVFVQLQLEGQCIERQNGRQAALRAGDFTLCDSSRSYETSFSGPNRMLLLGMPSQRLRRYVREPGRLAAIPVRSTAGAGALLSDFLARFWEDFKVGMSASSADRCVTSIFSLLSAVYPDETTSDTFSRGLVATHRTKVLDYIESRLTDHDLNPATIAEACKISTRYVHHLFMERDETVSAYIMRRRLERCRLALTAPGQRARTVTEIAFEHGFNSHTHFCRVFRAAFGATPREFRRCAASAGR